MEKKTIGAFIAALRKANGMTQRELAEALHVSDKTVSRWERDDGAPDLSLIPVIAELFGVTCDELLRGERASAEARSMPAPDAPISPRGDRAVRHLLAESLRRFRSQSLISAGIAFAGLMTAMIANLAFLRGYIGFFLGLIFCAAGAICQWIFTDRAWHAADDGVEPERTNQYRWQVFRIAAMSYGAVTAMAAVLLPLLLSGGAYYGLTLTAWLLLALVCLAAALIAGYVTAVMIRQAMLRRGVLTLEAAQEDRLRRNLRLQWRMALGTVAALAVTLALHVCLYEIFSAHSIAQGQKFADYESFAAFMEQPVAGAYRYDANISVTAPLDGADEEIPLTTLTLADGTIVCQYRQRNHSVTQLRYREQDGTLLPIEVITYHDVEVARVWITLREIAFLALYAAEVSLGAMGYFRRRAR